MSGDEHTLVETEPFGKSSTAACSGVGSVR